MSSGVRTQGEPNEDIHENLDEFIRALNSEMSLSSFSFANTYDQLIAKFPQFKPFIKQLFEGEIFAEKYDFNVWIPRDSDEKSIVIKRVLELIQRSKLEQRQDWMTLQTTLNDSCNNRHIMKDNMFTQPEVQAEFNDMLRIYGVNDISELTFEAIVKAEIEQCTSQ